MTAPWFVDAVFYEVPVYAFFDADGDGIGDFRGLTEKLDYLEWLGVTCIWLLPFYESPMRDGGYDISDFRSVLPRYGTLDDVRDFLDEAHRRGLRVIADMIVNHTSDQHPWFQEARRPGSPLRSRYVWSDTADRYTDARVIFTDTHDSNWTWDPVADAYYWHRFFDHQPDLNFDDAAVKDEIEDVIRFWLALGFDGLRLDAVPYLFERHGTDGENLLETHAYLKRLRAMVDAEFGDRMLLAEANQWPEDVVDYFGDGDEFHMAYHFPLMPRLFMAIAQGRADAVIDILERTPEIPDGCRWGIFLRNHDELTLEMVTEEDREYLWDRYAPDPAMRKNLGIRRRLAPLLSGDRRRIELLNVLLLSLPGSPFLYYGDEIGMGDDFLLEDRDGVRTPMQWDDTANAGFTTADPQDLYLPTVTSPEYSPAVVNVADQHDDPESLLRWTREMLAVRADTPALTGGDFRIVEANNAAVFAFVRTDHIMAVLVVANFSDDAVSTNLAIDPARWAAAADSGSVEFDGSSLTLQPYAWAWFQRN
ncbi:MAG: maltose alpha-D-glucosyltransferase [Actinomycetota bacterium]|nr:maltose alpha-D-glucosyltransferase [Actinomycetota bacterium]